MISPEGRRRAVEAFYRPSVFPVQQGFVLMSTTLPEGTPKITVRISNEDARRAGTGSRLLEQARRIAEQRAKGKSLTGDYAARIDKKHACYVIDFEVKA